MAMPIRGQNEDDTSAKELSRQALLNLGVSCYWLKFGFLKEVSSTVGLSEISSVYEILEPAIQSKGSDTVCPLDGRLGASYVHALQQIEPEMVGPATCMLSYSWKHSVGDIVDTVSNYCHSHNLDTKTTFVWICCLCNNQHRVAENAAEGKHVPFEEFRELFYSRVVGIGHVLTMLTPWQSPVYLKRVWCIFELFSATTFVDGDRKVQTTIVMPTRERNSLVQDLARPKRTCKGIHRLYKALAQTRVEDATASHVHDKENIFRMIEEGPGFRSLNWKVNELLRNWVARIIQEALRERVSLHSKQPCTEGSDRDLATLFSSVGHLLRRHGQSMDNSLDCHQQALAIQLKVLGKNHLDTAISFKNIALILQSKGDYEGALYHFQQALEIRLSLLGESNMYTASSYNSIGLTLSDMGDFDAALVHFYKAKSIREELLGENNRETKITYENIGMAFFKKGDYDKGLHFFQRSLQQRPGRQSSSNGSTSNKSSGTAWFRNLGGILCFDDSLADFEFALQYHREVLEARLPVCGVNHPNVAQSNHFIGLALYYLGEYQASADHHRIAHSIRKSIFGDSNPQTTESLEALTMALGKCGSKREDVDWL